MEMRRREHVIAIPAGENALLVRLESFLIRRGDEDSLADRLWEASRP